MLDFDAWHWVLSEMASAEIKRLGGANHVSQRVFSRYQRKRKRIERSSIPVPYSAFVGTRRRRQQLRP